ncbi:TPA: flagellar hook-length control protein FliK [Escherichia coli]|uniref:flagellar hook-length control protein FliK n=1 Tax=Escherichia coli TaxID=562 RepID=UPI0012F7781B|nr:flagellar hook-length control protein FliK [Escherichia coli]EGL6379566.1 flagellar hook-length control protein FliK [Escherichia coli]EGL6384230.1 flagellar hook-length control protein FliK [Escherichia coli]EKY6757921.1 flagellar hook-length control protein FliK [Escherichia coli]EKY6762496.1 flagellar hook-length control protein FliK [Escherichia coli]HAY1732070.1 flagellar hook-length control protein FliK [Escherichia coli]
MNPALLATLGTLAETASLKADILPPVSGENAPVFTLPKMVVAAVAERVHSAKTSQQQATRPQENDPVAMQALMALLLPQPAAPQRPTQQQELTSLPPQLQELIGQLPQAKPEQQARLATYASEDLHAIAPTQPRVSTPPARPKPELTRVTARPQVERKTEKVPDSEPVIARAVLQVKTPELVSDHQEIVAKPATLSMDELGEKLTTLLKDQIHFQLNKQQQISTIRLDPPSLGKLEIAVQLDNGKLTVHIGANQSEVCRALQQFSDDLRQHLTAQNFMEVNVQVSSEGQSQQQQQSGHQQEEVSAALQLDDAPQFQQNESVLIKV